MRRRSTTDASLQSPGGGCRRGTRARAKRPHPRGGRHDLDDRGHSGGGSGSAIPDLDAAALVASIPSLAGDGLEVSTLSNLPSAHLSLDDQLRICRAARDFARRGVGVVVTHGTDTMEETAMLCDVLHDAEAPIVFTGAIRPASAPGADGPANTVDAVSVAASEAAAGMGVLVCFGGEIHHARGVRKTDTTSLVAFSSPADRPARPSQSRATRRSGRGSRATRRSTLPTSTAASSSSPPLPATTARSRGRRSRPSPTAP